MDLGVESGKIDEELMKGWRVEGVVDRFVESGLRGGE